MFTIHLKSLQFFSFHGVHEEERVLGGNFVVDTAISFATVEAITDLQETIDYTKIYTLIKQRMAVPTALLETLAQDLAHQISGVDRRITVIDIKITKSNPPITEFSGSIAVSFKKDFSV